MSNLLFELHMWRVGGTCRDRAISNHFGTPFECNDDDLAVTLREPVEQAFVASTLRDIVEADGFEVFKVDEGTMTVRAKVPAHRQDMFLTNVVDFAHTREESSESNGRRPDEVWAVFGENAILADLRRRDFTIGAIAETMIGAVIDPHDGVGDACSSTLRFVGDPLMRIQEDGLRVLRGLRFMVTKNLVAAPSTWEALCSSTAVEMLAATPLDRFDDELNKMFKFDTAKSINVLASAFSENSDLEDALFRENCHLTASLKKVKHKG